MQCSLTLCGVAPLYTSVCVFFFFFFFFQAEDGIRDTSVTGVQTCALPICANPNHPFPRALFEASQGRWKWRAHGESGKPRAGFPHSPPALGNLANTARFPHSHRQASPQMGKWKTRTRFPTSPRGARADDLFLYPTHKNTERSTAGHARPQLRFSCSLCIRTKLQFHAHPSIGKCSGSGGGVGRDAPSTQRRGDAEESAEVFATDGRSRSFCGAEKLAGGVGHDSEEEGEGQDDYGELATGPEAGDNGAGGAGGIQGDAQVDGGGLGLTGTVVDDEHVVAGFADAEVERAGLADGGRGQQTVGEAIAQMREIGAGHESQTDLVGT